MARIMICWCLVMSYVMSGVHLHEASASWSSTVVIESGYLFWATHPERQLGRSLLCTGHTMNQTTGLSTVLQSHLEDWILTKCQFLTNLCTLQKRKWTCLLHNNYCKVMLTGDHFHPRHQEVCPPLYHQRLGVTYLQIKAILETRCAT